jgi:hypothetical protein
MLPSLEDLRLRMDRLAADTEALRIQTEELMDFARSTLQRLRKRRAERAEDNFGSKEPPPR